MRLTSHFAAFAILSASVACGQAPVPKHYEPTWASLDSRPIPQWFKDAKFGIFIHWGLYSVPSWGAKGSYAEWYWNYMQDHNGPTWKFHQRVYGPNFKYEDFASQFHAELFDPQAWAEVLARSGARYVALTSKHHEGFALWPSAEATKTWGRPWNSVDTGPKRDLLGDLSVAVRARGLKMGIYYSLYEWYNPLYRTDFARYRDEHF
nr:alpha-L-fucosidase [Armatimonadota bacterium]